MLLHMYVFALSMGVKNASNPNNLGLKDENC